MPPKHDPFAAVIEGLPVVFEHFLEQLRTELATSTNGIPDTGARVVPLRTGGNSKPSSSRGAVVGWSLYESTGAAAAQLTLWDGPDNGGEFITRINLGPGESTRDWFGPGGIGFGRGLFVEAVSGSVAGSVFLRAVE